MDARRVWEQTKLMSRQQLRQTTGSSKREPELRHCREYVFLVISPARMTNQTGPCPTTCLRRDALMTVVPTYTVSNIFGVTVPTNVLLGQNTAVLCSLGSPIGGRHVGLN